MARFINSGSSRKAMNHLEAPENRICSSSTNLGPNGSPGLLHRSSFVFVVSARSSGNCPCLLAIIAKPSPELKTYSRNSWARKDLLLVIAGDVVFCLRCGCLL
ncbi:hypothetical protein CEXT_29981 [Caerostris extrusa]|uniref:Uncharacterized protein n=1 Tax=Caerostris extrusa TaxID=172846 RepID=A0AAV4YE03_CAEEX|nr:hypothetical protein CEXT_29981 [Caerostris extrusa]